ncbi:MAG: T9SS type A sorting domain-containing protein [Bacteroidetes bacterium]|nr:T9SS type A sorting domain-containing protein [Bacteroidota bacterium]
MKKTITLLAVFALAIAVHAQLINPGFETWTNDLAVPTAMNPNSGNGTTGWWDYNFFNSPLVGSSPVSVFRCDTAHSGNFSARIKTTIYTPTSWNIYKAWGIPFIGHNYSDTLGIVFDGNLNETNQVFQPGIPCTQKLTSFSFYYQYFPQAGDTAECRVLLVKQRNAVAGGWFKTNVATGLTWQQATITFAYVDTVTPDTLYTLFSSSSLDRLPKPGSIFLIDDASVTGASGVNQILADESRVDVFPNPASNEINFHVAGVNNAATISIVDITGKEISSVAIHSNLTTVNTHAYSDGLYFYQLYNKAGNLIKSDKFSVVK